MHELPITQSILDITVEHARRAGGGRVTRVHLVVGELSKVVDDCVQFYWDILSEGTLAQGAQLAIRRPPLELHCQSCDATFQPSEQDFRCTACGGSEVRVTGGDEFWVEALDIEDETGETDQPDPDSSENTLQSRSTPS